MSENMNKTIPASDEGKSNSLSVTSGLQQSQEEKYSNFVRRILCTKVQQEEAIKAVVEVLLGQMNTVETELVVCSTGEVWETSITLDGPVSEEFDLGVNLNPKWCDRWCDQWGEPFQDSDYYMSVKCLKKKSPQTITEMLQFEIEFWGYKNRISDLKMSELMAPISFIAGEHMTSGAVFEVISRIYEFYALMSHSDAEDEIPEDEIPEDEIHGRRVE